jgi:hypothetical protein
MATLAELQDALVNADKAGDREAARQLADAIVSMQQTQEAKPAAVKAGEAINSIPRQLGLTARYGLQGLAKVSEIATEPIRRLVTDPLLGVKTRPLSQQAASFADLVGLPSPQGANERVIGDAAEMVAGAGGLGGVGRLAQAAPGLVGKAGEMLASNLPQQLAAATGAGLAGGSAREAGAGPGMQAAAALVGGVATPLAANSLLNAGRRVAGSARAMLAPQVVQNEVDQQINLVLRQQGIDWAQIPERIKQPMRAEVSRALATGEDLNPAALRRLLDFQTVGATPTRGMLTQDPVQITREMNLAKTGANSTDIGLQRLPQLQNQNTATLLRNLDEAGAQGAPDALATGERIIDSLNRNASAARGNINNLYSSARDTAGRSAPLDSQAFVRRAGALLDDNNVGSFLPPDIRNRLNAISEGRPGFELTVDAAEQLKTSIGNIQRGSTNGNERRALGLVRQALDEAPLRSAPTVNPGNLPAVPGTVPTSPAVLGEQSINAFNQARSANRAFMQRVEQTPAMQAAIDGAQPDRFVQQFILGQGRDASVAAVNRLRQEIGTDTQTLEAVKQNIVSHLRNAATNGTEDVTKFSPAAYNKALNAIGERKLELFFNAEELRRLQAVGRVGTLMTAQPTGAAVNNSNSGALLLGRGLDMLDSVAGRLPLGLDTTIQGVLRGTQQGRALSVPRSLLMPEEPVPMLNRLSAPAFYGGLFAAQPPDQR